jgi:hypothetical protein
MTTRTRLAAAAMIAAGAVAGATALPALTGAQSAGGRDVTVAMKVRGGTEVPHGKRTPEGKLAPGDALVIRLKMFSPDGAPLGSAATECVNVGGFGDTFKAKLQCVQTYDFEDGQIVTAGVVRFSQLEGLAVPIVGGSGAYRGASGQVTSGAPIEGFESIDVLQLDG